MARKEPFILAFITSCLLLPQICALSLDDDFDPYAALGLERSASQIQIKKAYKRLVMEWHPDRNKNPEAEERFLQVNRAYKIISNEEKREAFDKFGIADEDFVSDWRTFSGQQFFREQQQNFQYIRWPPPPRKQQTDLKNFILPFASVLGTLFFIFAIGLVLNQLNTAESNNRRRRTSNHESSSSGTANNNQKTNKDQKEWHPEDPKAPLTEEEKQQRMQARIWRTMGPLIRELRAETQFGLIRLLKPGCRSIIVLIDHESKDSLLQQFARYTYCLRNNKTFSFGFLVVPKNLVWFRSLLELTLPGDEQEEPKDDSASVSTATTDTNSKEKEPEEKIAAALDGKFVNNCRKMSAKDRLKNINPKHTLGTVLVICGWKLYFSIYHPMHRPAPRSTVQLETLGDADEDEPAEQQQDQAQRKRNATNKDKEATNTNGNASLNVENVLNGFPTFLERLLEGTVRRYYVPEWPENLV